MRAKIGRNSGALSGLPATLVKTWTPRAPSVLHRAVDLGERGLDIVHRQRGDEGREAVRMLAAEGGQLVIGDARELRRAIGRRDQLERRIGKRNDLLQVVEFVERGEPRLDVPQRLEPRKGGDRHVPGNKVGQAVEIRLWHEVIEDVDDHEPDDRW